MWANWDSRVPRVDFIIMNENLDEESTFTQEIEKNSHICDNCYRRLRFVLKPHESMPDVVGDKMEYTNEAHFAYFDDRQETGRPSRKKSYCKCGNVDDAKIRPLDKKEMMETAERVIERLDEEGIDVDEELFLNTVYHHKSDPDNQFNEEVILEEAVKRTKE